MPVPSFPFYLRFTAATALAITVTPLAAHEFWIEPDYHTRAAGDDIVAGLRVGQNYHGETFPYLSPRFETFTITDDGGTHDYRGNQGDEPALRTTADTPGLTVITYVSKPSRLHYKKWETFVNYTANEGLTGAVEAHLDAGLPKTGFRETYQRHAKAMIQVGPVRPDDRETAQGLDFELVALGNPFDPAIDVLPVRLLRFGEPAPDVQIAIFRKTADDAEGGTGVEKLRTDDAGRAEITLQDGARHLLNAVVMDRSTETGIDWDSDWASLTFARP